MNESFFKYLVGDLLQEEIVKKHSWNGKKEEIAIFVFGRLLGFFNFDGLLMGHDPH